MHEFSITESLLKLALEKAAEVDAGKITGLHISIGAMAGIEGSCVQFYFEALARDTIAAGAELTFEVKPTRARCRSCGADYTPEEQNWACPSCGTTAVEVVSGRDCYLESLEVEQ